jgi:Divalent cation transporter
MLGLVGIVRISLWQYLGFYDYGEHWMLIALTVGAALVGIVMFGSLTGSMLPFILQRTGFDPASASAPFVATLVDVTGLVIYFTVASLILRGTLLYPTARAGASTFPCADRGESQWVTCWVLSGLTGSFVSGVGPA